MKTGNSKRTEKNLIKKLLKTVIILLLSLGILAIFYKDRVLNSFVMSGRYGWEMVTIFPAVLVLMGLADSWIPKKLIKKYLGQEAGAMGILIAVFLGTLPTGPMYIAFPLAGEMLHKGAGITNVVVFLGVWASLKIPQIGVEVQFLGIKFSILRFVFTLISIISIGLITEQMAKGGRDYVREE